ncbi:MAG: immune inhibitor A domain-containing protein, partial [Thermoleophilia bacterium]
MTIALIDFSDLKHNTMPQPDRTKDNSTYWTPDFSVQHYKDMLFTPGGGSYGNPSLTDFYQELSSGRFAWDGQVSNWTTVNGTKADFGANSEAAGDGGDDANGPVSRVVKATLDGLTASGNYGGIDIATADKTDRYDCDGDGNFNEPDGYIDHFGMVHAGGGEDSGVGDDAIWSHRSYANLQPDGPNGLVGVNVGSNAGAFSSPLVPDNPTGVWVGDYTVQPENGGLGVFAHEYGHDLGLPDHYDAATDNPVNWWTLMGQSRNSAPQDQGIGTRAADLGAWDKLQLGWLDYEIVPAGTVRTLDLGPHEYNSAKAQGVVVPLGKTRPVDTDYGAPYAGTKQWYSQAGDDLDNTLTRQVTLPAGPASLTFQAKWNIEDCGPDPCDFAFVEVDSGSGWTAIPGSITKPAEKNGIDGIQETNKTATIDL